MSLNRVSSLETFSRSPSPSLREQRLTFNPLPESWDPQAGKPGYVHSIGAFEVPRWKRILQVFVTVVYCLLAAGIVFGYAALKPVLKREGAYQDVCGGRGDDADMCVEIHLNLMFTVAAVATNVAALPVGALLDHCGPRVCGLLGAVFLAVGSLLMAYERAVPFDGLLCGYLFLALGGPFTYISAFQLSNAFPRHSGFILALLTGAFDASSALFLGYRLLFEQTAGAVGHDRFFLGYLVVPAAIVLLQLFVLPRKSYKTIGEMIEDAGHLDSRTLLPALDDQVDENAALLAQERREQRAAVAADWEGLLESSKVGEQARKEEQKNARSGVWGVMHHATAWQQIRSPWFILLCLFTVIQMTRINYFVATIRPQYEALLGSAELAVQVNNFFDVALPVGGVLSIPFIGLLLDHASTAAVLATLAAAAAAVGLLGVVPALWAAYANVGLFVLYRPLYYTAVSDYAAKVFGFRTFGTVYGAVVCLAGALNLAQAALDVLRLRACRGDPVPVNLLLLGLGLAAGAALAAFVAAQARALRRNGRGRGREARGAAGLHN